MTICLAPQLWLTLYVYTEQGREFDKIIFD